MFLSSEETARFESHFAKLTQRQQDWLIFRLRFNSDREACEELGIACNTMGNWKKRDARFLECYDLLLSGVANIEAAIVMAIERQTAVQAALERRAIIFTPWKGMTEREKVAKSTAINDTLERVAPKRSVRQTHSTISILDARKEDAEVEKTE